MLGVLVLVLITAATPGIRAEDPTATRPESVSLPSAAASTTRVRCGPTANPCAGAPNPSILRRDSIRWTSARPRRLTTSGLWASAAVAFTPAGCEKTAQPCAGVRPSMTSRRDTVRWDSVSPLRLTMSVFTAISSGGLAHLRPARGRHRRVLGERRGMARPAPPDRRAVHPLQQRRLPHLCVARGRAGRVLGTRAAQRQTYGRMGSATRRAAGRVVQAPGEATMRPAPGRLRRCAGELGRTWSMKAYRAAQRIDSSP